MKRVTDIPNDKSATCWTKRCTTVKRWLNSQTKLQAPVHSFNDFRKTDGTKCYFENHLITPMTRYF